MIDFLIAFSDELESYGNVHFEELSRDDEGKAIIDGIEITYRLAGSISRYSNDTRQDVSLQLDIWCLKKDLLKKELVIQDLEKIHRKKYCLDDGIYLVDRDNLFRIELGDEDKYIMRTRLQYIVRKLN